MVQPPKSDSVFPALLRYWRNQRGLSQLDLGLTSDVSAKHISFLETGRSQPSIEMVLLLAETMAVPLRDRNELLRSAGFQARYPEPQINDLLGGPLGVTVDTMLTHHDPFPMMLVDRCYNVVRANHGAALFLSLAGITEPVGTNVMRLVYRPAVRELLTNWDDVASDLLRRLQREVLTHPNDTELRQLLDDLLGDSDVPPAWRSPDLLNASEPMLTVQANLDGTALELLATITVFNSPSNVTLEELKIESYLPTDAATRDYFSTLQAPADRR